VLRSGVLRPPLLHRAPAEERLEPVTVTVSRTVRPQLQPEFEAWARGVLAVAARQPGYLGASLLRPGPGSRDYHLVYRFRDSNALHAWETSAERRDWLRRARPLVEEERVASTAGLEQWFSLPDRAGRPPKWKTALLVIAAIYPLSQVLGLLVAPHLAALPTPVRALVLSVCTVSLMTWLVMPGLGRLFHRWLDR